MVHNMVHNIEGEELVTSAGYPPGIEGIPGAVRIDDVANPIGLFEIARDYISQNRLIMRLAKKRGKDMVAFATSHGREIIIGAGVASIVTAATAGGIILYKHRHRKRK